MSQNSPHGLPCVDCQTFIEEYIAGELDTATESAMTSHLATCERCRHEFRLAQAIDEVLDELPRPVPPPDIFREVSAYVRAHSRRRSWIHRIFQLSTLLAGLRSPLLHAGALVCLVGVVLFGVHQHQQKVQVEQAAHALGYALSKVQYAMHRSSRALNETLSTVQIEETHRRALKQTANVSSAIRRSLSILNQLTDDIRDTGYHQPSNSESIQGEGKP